MTDLGCPGRLNMSIVEGKRTATVFASHILTGNSYVWKISTSAYGG